MTRYRITFDTVLRLTTELGAASEADAHFTAFCEAAALLQNDSTVTRQFGLDGFSIDQLSPYRITIINESNDQ